VRRENNPSSHIANEDPNKSRRTMAQSCRHFEEYTTLGIIPHVRVLGSFSRKRTNNNTQGEKNTTRKERKSMSITFPHFFCFSKEFIERTPSLLLLTEFPITHKTRTHKQHHAHTHSTTPQQALPRPPPGVSLARVLTFHDDKLIIHFVGPSRTTVAVPPLAARAATPPVLIMEIWISLPTIFSVDASGLRYLR